MGRHRAHPDQRAQDGQAGPPCCPGNSTRSLDGAPSESKAIKARVKEAVNHVSNFEEHIAQLARERGCVGVMCGHIHTAADKMIGDIHYLNSGDWAESLTAIVEHWDGRFEVVNFTEFIRSYPMDEAESVEGAPHETAEV